jgi:hypothetical protein
MIHHSLFVNANDYHSVKGNWQTRATPFAQTGRRAIMPTPGISAPIVLYNREALVSAAPVCISVMRK